MDVRETARANHGSQSGQSQLKGRHRAEVEEEEGEEGDGRIEPPVWRVRSLITELDLLAKILIVNLYLSDSSWFGLIFRWFTHVRISSIIPTLGTSVATFALFRSMRTYIPVLLFLVAFSSALHHLFSDTKSISGKSLLIDWVGQHPPTLLAAAYTYHVPPASSSSSHGLADGMTGSIYNLPAKITGGWTMTTVAGNGPEGGYGWGGFCWRWYLVALDLALLAIEAYILDLNISLAERTERDKLGSGARSEERRPGNQDDTRGDPGNEDSSDDVDVLIDVDDAEESHHSSSDSTISHPQGSVDGAQDSTDDLSIPFLAKRSALETSHDLFYPSHLPIHTFRPGPFLRMVKEGVLADTHRGSPSARFGADNDVEDLDDDRRSNGEDGSTETQYNFLRRRLGQLQTLVPLSRAASQSLVVGRTVLPDAIGRTPREGGATLDRLPGIEREERGRLDVRRDRH